jgi:SAM-dependent methyltransferase
VVLERLPLALALVFFVACTPAPQPDPAASRPPPTAPPPTKEPAAPAASAPSVAPSASAAASARPAGAEDPLEAEARRMWGEGKREDIIYVPTPQLVVDKMLEVAKVTKDDVVYDLGCGDGRIVVAAAKRFGATGVGFDLDPARVKEARANVTAAGVDALTTIKWANVFSVDLEPASVVMLYLLPELNVRLIPQLEKLRKGSRIVSHDFDMKGVVPDAHYTITAPEFVNAEGYSAYKGEKVPEDKKHYKQRKHDIFVWTVPLKKEPSGK